MKLTMSVGVALAALWLLAVGRPVPAPGAGDVGAVAVSSLRSLHLVFPH